jgi:hypothetical protein
MDPIHISRTEALVWVTIINAAVGFFLGLIPLGFGMFRDRKRLGILGIFATTIGGAILGVFLSIPAMAIFTYLIIRKKEDGLKTPAAVEEDQI